MAELAFIMKTFFMSCVFIVALQYKVNGVSAEDRIFSLLTSDSTVGWLKSAGDGAVRLTASTYQKVVDPKAAAAAAQVEQQDIIRQQQELYKRQEQEWVERVEKAVDGGGE